MKRILITGGSGYLGSRLAVFLAKLDFQITIATRKKPEEHSHRQICPDVNYLHTLENEEVKFDRDYFAIIHLSTPNEVQSNLNPQKAIADSNASTIKYLSAAKNYGVNRFIYFSTVHVYGKDLVGNISESFCPDPCHPYSIGHLSSEFLVKTLSGPDLIPIILRLSNAFGPPACLNVNRWTLLVNDLCMQAVRGNQMILKSSGAQLRDFITIDDVSKALELLLTLDEGAFDSIVYNLGSGTSLSVYSMAIHIQERAKKILGRIPDLVVGKSLSGENILPFKLSIKRLNDLGFIPENRLEDEIDATLRYCQELVSS